MAAKTAKGDNIYAAIGLNLGALGISGCFARVRVSGSKAAVQIKAKMLYDRYQAPREDGQDDEDIQRLLSLLTNATRSLC